jgi:hypothetical protein
MERNEPRQRIVASPDWAGRWASWQGAYRRPRPRPPLWETAPECADSGRKWDPSLAPVPANEFDQRIDW